MRARLLVLASSLSLLGWGTILPFQYAYAADTRGWGPMTAALSSTLFSVGALAAAPVGGRLADRYSAVRVAVIGKTFAGFVVAALILADTPVTFLAAMAVFGAGVTAAQPAQTMLVLEWTAAADRRRVFAWQFSGSALGMAVGAWVAGRTVDLARPDGMDVSFAIAAAGFLASAALLVIAERVCRPVAVELGPAVASTDDLGGLDGAMDGTSGVAGGVADRREALRAIVRSRSLRWTAVVTVALSLGFYAQFETGLPAYALTVLKVQPSAVGTAAIVNSIVIIALQMVVVRLTRNRAPASLLIVVGVIWVASWLLLSLGLWWPGLGATLFVGAYAVFGIGETMYAPVLNPLTASLAPTGYVGTTLGLFSSLQTALAAFGPLVAGVLLGSGWSAGYVGLHLGIAVLALVAAVRLRTVLRSREPRPTARTRPASSGVLERA